jgi:hypothetical protein
MIEWPGQLVRVASAFWDWAMVEVQAVVQAQGLAVGDKPRVEPLAADPRSTLGGPGRRVQVGAEQGADLGEPLVQDVRGPVPHALCPGPLRDQPAPALTLS